MTLGTGTTNIIVGKSMMKTSNSNFLELCQSVNYEEEILLIQKLSEYKQYISGNTKLEDFLVGQIMHSTHGKANPKVIREKLRLRK
jgi:Asp-tRNA(Asn)/Glu-tRNA(Gln) amidotransferase B subunit